MNVGLLKDGKPAPSTHAERLVWSHRYPDGTIETRRLVEVICTSTQIPGGGVVYHATPITQRVVRRFPR